MIKITSKSAQNEVIQELFLVLSHQSPLYVELESLPYFLSSIPSLKVFLFKIQNYPRPIFWHSYDNNILDFLHLNKINIEFPYNPQNAIVHISSNSPTIINLNKQETKQTPNDNYIDYNQKLSQLKLKIRKSNNPTNSSFDISEHTQSTDYSSKNSEKIDFKQDLDSWLQKIENTKDSLSKFKNDIVNQKNLNASNGSIISPKWFFRALLSFCIVSLAVVFVLFFPTNVYKLDIAPTIKQSSHDLQFSDTVFLKNKFKIQTQDDTETTGQNQINISEFRASGKVALINTSATAISFKKDGVIMISQDNGLEYRQKSNDNDAGIFTVLPKNNLSNQPIEIDIQSIASGNNIDLPINSNFRVYNIRGETFGGTIKAISTSKIESTNKINKTITPDDLSLLRSKAEVSLNNQKQKKLEELKNIGQFVNNNWIKTLDTTYKFSGVPSDSATKVIVDAESEIEIYSLNDGQLNQLVATQLQLSNISDIKIAETKIENDKVIAKIFLSSRENPEILKKDIIGNFASVNINENTTQIQQKYPNIKGVSKNFSGLKLPLVTPRSKIEINELNIN